MTTKTFDVTAVFRFVEPGTGCIIDFNAPFPIIPDDSLIYQALRAACEQGKLEAAEFGFVDSITGEAVSMAEVDERAAAYEAAKREEAE